jgi:SnoaL-like domain
MKAACCASRSSAPAFVATNWFRRIDGAWRMIHHQAGALALQVEDDVPKPGSRRLN